MEVKIVTTEKEREDAFYVRKTVFVDEQGIPAQIEIDNYDDKAIHFVAYDQGKPIGAGRLRIFSGYGKGERVSVIASYRRKGVGEHIMKAMEEKLIHDGIPKITLHAQLQAKPFYEKIGYIQTSEVFYEADTPHVSMEKNLL